MIVVFKYRVPDQQQGLLGELSSSIGQAFFSKEKLDIDQTVEEYSNPVPTKPKFKQGLDSVRLVSGKTHEDLELPDAAALMYPDLNRVAAQAVRCEEDMGTASGINRLQEKFQGAGERVSDYMNRRAQVIYVSRAFVYDRDGANNKTGDGASWRFTLCICIF
jgi:hypothetical protein